MRYLSLVLAECPPRCFRFFRLQATGYRLQATGVRRQASGVRRQASGVRRQASGVLDLILVSLFISFIAGCQGKFSDASLASQATTTNRSSNEMRYDGGFVFADHEHVIGIDVDSWGIASLSQVQRLQTSCECVHASLIKMDDGPKKIILVLRVAADAKMARSTSLAVQIEAILTDGSTKLLSFEFTNVAIPALN